MLTVSREAPDSQRWGTASARSPNRCRDCHIPSPAVRCGERRVRDPLRQSAGKDGFPTVPDQTMNCENETEVTDAVKGGAIFRVAADVRRRMPSPAQERCPPRHLGGYAETMNVNGRDISDAVKRVPATGRDRFHPVPLMFSPARAQGDSPGWSEARRAQPWVTCPQTFPSPVRAKQIHRAGSRSIIRDCPALAGLDFISSFYPGLGCHLAGLQP